MAFGIKLETICTDMYFLYQLKTTVSPQRSHKGHPISSDSDSMKPSLLFRVCLKLYSRILEAWFPQTDFLWRRLFVKETLAMVLHSYTAKIIYI